MAQASGVELSQSYQHELMRIDGMDCSTCATVIEHAPGRLDGLLEALIKSLPAHPFSAVAAVR